VCDVDPPKCMTHELQVAAGSDGCQQWRHRLPGTPGSNLDDPANNRKHHERNNEVRSTVVGRSRNRWRRLLSRPSQAPTRIPSCRTAPIPTARTCSPTTLPTTTKRTPRTVKWTRLSDRDSPPNPLGGASNRDRRQARAATTQCGIPECAGSQSPARTQAPSDRCLHPLTRAIRLNPISADIVGRDVA